MCGGKIHNERSLVSRKASSLRSMIYRTNIRSFSPDASIVWNDQKTASSSTTIKHQHQDHRKTSTQTFSSLSTPSLQRPSGMNQSSASLCYFSARMASRKSLRRAQRSNYKTLLQSSALRSRTSRTSTSAQHRVSEHVVTVRTKTSVHPK